MYSTFILEPIVNALIFFYSLFNDMGIAIIILTILIRLILFPLSNKALITSRKIQEIQSKIDKIKQDFKNDKEKQAIETMKIYKEANINVVLPFLNIFLQILVLFALYKSLVISQNLNDVLPKLYSITPHPDNLTHKFLGLIDLSAPNVYFAFIAALATYWQIKISPSASPQATQSNQKQGEFGEFKQMAQKMTKQLNLILPLITFLAASKFSSALSLYWIVSTLFTIGQEYYIKRKNNL
jgi:YidC/Oxa1 family membrane protein insertase